MSLTRVFPWLGVLALLCTGCPRQPEPPPPPPLPRLSVEEVERLIPPGKTERRGWAEDVLAAFGTHGLWPDAPAVCSVLAVIEQESGFVANPAVPRLAAIVRAELEEKLAGLGPARKPVLAQLLSGKAPGAKQTFQQRLDKVRTEQDLDRLYRDLLDHYRAEFPNAYQAANLASSLAGKSSLEEQNPITTAGSMQVSVSFARALAARLKRDGWAVRDALYTRRGGVDYGTARLLGYSADYPQPVYRFADYNAGFFASRNAALQVQLTELTGLPLAIDGDLLAYGKDGKPLAQESNTLRALLQFRERLAPGLSEWTLRREVKKEKAQAFEETETWRTLQRVYRERTGKEWTYARLPDVTLESPKLQQQRSTAWFARNVNLRFEKCMGRRAKAAPR
ncbi:MAG: DUF1615 domain-containing protein [Myxococcota bacterium]|nr:DUF1615 domain-containing protein [Myxococcota bacterium]